MKKPRANDFDPKANERRLKSTMENMPAIESRPIAREAAEPVPVVPEPWSHGTMEPLESASDRRRIVKRRYAIDIYQDQVEALKRIAFEEKMQGGLGSVSAMVRDALDAYLDKRR